MLTVLSTTGIHLATSRQLRRALTATRLPLQRTWDDYLRLAAALCEIKRATLSRTQPSPHTGSCPGASAPSSGSISRPRALSKGPSCTVNQLSPLRFSLPHTAHRSFPDWFGSFVVTARRACALAPSKLTPEERAFTGHTKGLTLVLALIEHLRRGFTSFVAILV